MMNKTTIILLLTACAVGISADADAASIRLKSSAQGVEGQIRLIDIATVDDCSDGLKRVLEEVKVTEGPADGAVVTVTLDDVRRTLRAAGVDMTQVQLSGATRIRVKGSPRSEQHAGRQGRLAEKVIDAVLDVASKELGRKRDDLSVRDVHFIAFGVPDKADVTVTASEAVKLSGKMKFKGTATVEDEQVGTFDVTVTLHCVKRVLVAKRRLAIGTTIRAADLEFRSIESDAVKDTVFELTSTIVGERLAKRVRKGQVIIGSMIARQIMVKSGDVCALIVRGRGFHIRTEAKALGKGGLGEEVKMQNIKTRRRFTAVVVGRRRVEVQGFAKEKR